jgi:hypothetical protein
VLWLAVDEIVLIVVGGASEEVSGADLGLHPKFEMRRGALE